LWLTKHKFWRNKTKLFENMNNKTKTVTFFYGNQKKLLIYL
jgi:hypothetical protein